MSITPFISAQEWWNSLWGYRKPIVINNYNNVSLTDYQININITYDSKMQQDFSDLRFTWFNKNNNTEIKIPYWIEEKVDGSWAYIWIKVPEIPPNGNTTIYMYYGNPTATSESNRINTMTFTSVWNWTDDLTSYDDFISSFIIDNNYYLFAGEKRSGSNTDIFVVKKMNLTGGIIWTYEKDTGSCGSGSEELFDITVGENNTYAIVGEACAPYEGQYYFAKISPSGSLICEWTQEVGAADELMSVIYDTDIDRYVAVGRENSGNSVLINITPTCSLNNKITWDWGSYDFSTNIIIDVNNYIISGGYYPNPYRIVIEKREKFDFSVIWSYKDTAYTKYHGRGESRSMSKINNNYFIGSANNLDKKFINIISPNGTLVFNKTIDNDFGTLRGGDNAWLDGEAVFAGDRGFYLVLLNSTGDVIHKYNATLPYAADAVEVKKDYYKYCYILAGSDRKNGNSEWRIERICERKLVIPEPIVTFGLQESGILLSTLAPQTIDPYKNFSFTLTVRNATSGETVGNLAQGDFSVWKEGEQIGFSFANIGNGSYSLTLNSGNLLGNVLFRVCAKSACEEKSVKISIGVKDKIAFVGSDWLAVLNSGLLGKPLFRNYSETAKNFLSKYKPEQVFIMENATTDFSEYRFKDISAMVETFFSGAILVRTKEQALAAVPLAKLKNYGIIFDNNCGTILNLADKTPEQINDLVIKEARAQGKNINTIIIANPASQSSGLAGMAAAKYNSLIIPLQFPQPNYPQVVENFYQINQQNAVINAIEEINKTVKKLNDNRMFANNWEYKLGKQLNLILLGNRSEIPHAIVFDSGNEWFNDIDGNSVLTDYLYTDLNKDGKADLMVGRIVSEYQLLEGDKEKRIVTAASYRNIEFVYSGNGLIESMSTDTTFRNAGFSAVRLIENHTSLSYYNMSALSLVNVIGDFLEKLWKTDGIVDSLGLLFKIYGAYEEFLEHNLYKLMNSLEFTWSEGFVLHFFPDERLEKQRLMEEMRSAEGIFYYGVGNETAWLLPDKNNNYNVYFNFDEFPILNLPFVYNEYDKAMRGRIEKIIEKGAAAIAGPTGVVHGAHAFAFNSKFTQNIARNFSTARSIENAKFLTNQETKSLTEIISFNYNSIWPQPSIKQYLQTVLYAEPEFKIDPNYTEAEANPEISYNGSFVAKIKIPVNYTVLELNGTKLILFDAEQYLQEFYKPIIPVYTKEFLLPNGSQILRISVSYNTTNYTNVFVPVLMPDEYYQQENKTQEGFYPDKNFENTSFELLDRRKSLLLTAMPLMYNNKTKEAVLFNSIEFTIIYTSPLEILDFSAKDIKLGDEEMFSIKVKNVGNEKNITIALEIEGETIFEDYTIEANAENTFFVSYKPAKAGAYTAKAFLLFENNSVGPRYAKFHVSEKNILESMAVLPFKIFKALFPTKTEETYKTALEKISISKGALDVTIEYSAPQIKFISKSNATTIEKLLMKPGYRLEVIQQNGRVVQKITTADGYFSMEKNFGNVEEKCKGNCELMKIKLAETIAEMNNISIEIQEKIK